MAYNRLSQEKLTVDAVRRFFVPERLTTARERLGLTRKDLAAKILSKDSSITPGAITHFEKGRDKPSERVLLQLSWALRVDCDYFALPIPKNRLEFAECQFRAHANVSQKRRRQAIQATEEARELILFAIEALKLDGFPRDKIQAVRDEVMSKGATPEEAARIVRKKWAPVFAKVLGRSPDFSSPIHGILRLIEHLGVLIIPIPKAVQTQSVDAFSAWVDGMGVIALSQYDKSSSRVTYDVMHELGHLVMHDASSDEQPPGSREVERQANEFAGAFLLPKDGFAIDCPVRWSLEDFKHLKKKWQVSIAALVMRAKKLGIFSTREVQHAFRDLNIHGIRRREPNEWKLQLPTVVSQIVREIRDSELNKPDVVDFLEQFDWDYKILQPRNDSASYE